VTLVRVGVSRLRSTRTDRDAPGRRFKTNWQFKKDATSLDMKGNRNNLLFPVRVERSRDTLAKVLRHGLLDLYPALR
jgi:hypothetical protein